MRIIEPEVHVYMHDEATVIRMIESAARECYQSRGKEGALNNTLLSNGHLATFENANLRVKFIVDRGISHELVRHRICSFCQESTRYCNYSKGKFGSEITVIKPFMYEEGTPEYESWLRAQLACEKEYLFQVNDLGRSPQEARSCLPNSLKTSVSMNTNIREWLSIILSNTHSSSRTQKAAHPQMRQVMHPLALFLKAEYPILFGKVGFEETIDPKYYARVFKHAFDE